MHQHSGLVEWINVQTGCTPIFTHSIGNRIYLGSIYTPPIPRAIYLFYYSISYLTVIRVQLQVNLGDADCHVERRERPKPTRRLLRYFRLRGRTGQYGATWGDDGV